MRPSTFRDRVVAGVIVGALLVVATSCYRDFDFGVDAKADRWYVDYDGDWWDAATATKVLDAQPGDLPVPADWDGDHIWDTAVVRPNGDWVTGSARGTISFPAPAQLPAFVVGTGSKFHILPVPGDYDGDGDVEPAWYRDSDATWFIQGSAPISFGAGPTYWPMASRYFEDQDFPVPADYDGDAITDLATFNPRTLAWSVRSSADGTTSTVTMQHNGLLPLPAPADYDGVGHAQRATVGHEGWEIEGHDLVTYGAADGNYPAAADYDGDNHLELSYMSNAGVWKTQGSADTYELWTGPNAWKAYPLAFGHNRMVNIARITFVGQCRVNPSWCPPL